MKNVYTVAGVEYWATVLCLEDFKKWYLDRYAIELEDNSLNVVMPEKTIFLHDNINHLTIADYLETIDIEENPICIAIIW